MNDTHSIDAVIRGLYESISGPAGVERDWARFQALFHREAKLCRTVIAPDGTPQLKVMDPAAFQADTSAYFRREPFYEAEKARQTDAFGCIAHVFSTYESRHSAHDIDPFKRGINSIQLFHDGQRWWILSVVWDNEREGTPIPGKYL